jgi:hypothetical protein
MTENGSKKTDWNRIVTTGLGVILLGLQGVNLSELGSVGEQGRERAQSLKAIEQEGQQRAVALAGIEKTLANQGKILEHIDVSIEQNRKILENGSQLIQADTDQLAYQRKILDLLQKNLESAAHSAP